MTETPTPISGWMFAVHVLISFVFPAIFGFKGWRLVAISVASLFIGSLTAFQRFDGSHLSISLSVLVAAVGISAACRLIGSGLRFIIPRKGNPPPTDPGGGGTGPDSPQNTLKPPPSC